MEDGTGRFFINRSGTGGNPKRGGDFEEEDVWSIEMERSEDSSPGMGKSKAKDSTGPRMIPRANYSPKVAQQSSAPVNIPDWSKVYGSHGSSNKGKKMYHGFLDDAYGDDGGDDDDGEMVPPHEYMAKKLARSQISSFSMCEGIGRTLKGRDLSKVRNAILTKTGFLE